MPEMSIVWDARKVIRYVQDLAMSLRTGKELPFSYIMDALWEKWQAFGE